MNYAAERGGGRIAGAKAEARKYPTTSSGAGKTVRIVPLTDIGGEASEK